MGTSYLRIGSNSMIPPEYKGAVSHLCQMVDKKIFQLIDFARRMPYITNLHRNDQMMLLRCGWNEMLIAAVAWQNKEYIETERSPADVLKAKLYPSPEQCPAGWGGHGVRPDPVRARHQDDKTWHKRSSTFSRLLLMQTCVC